MLVKKPTKKQVEWEKRFNALVDDYMRGLGAEEKDPARPDFVIAGCHEPTGADWRIQTKAGPLKVIAYGDWIACRFDDPQKAAVVLAEVGLGLVRLNRFSGKWNHHFNPGQPICDEKDCVHFFKEELGMIL